MTAPELPIATRALLRQLEPAWSVQTRHATGPCTFGSLSKGTDGEGRRHRVKTVETVESVLVRACHVDGRALVALWVRRPGTTPTGRRKGWSLDLAWRGRHRDEHTPRPLSAKQLKAYVAASDHASALAALEPQPADEIGAAA